MSSNLNNLGQLNVTENCCNLTQIEPANPSDTSHPTYHSQKRGADAEYLGKVNTVLSSHIGGINFVDPVSMRKAHEELMNKVRTKATHISNRYKVQIKPLHFMWVHFIPMLYRE